MTTGWKSNLMNASSRNTHYAKSLHQNVTRCFHFSPKCSKIVGGWGSAPDPAKGAYIIYYHCVNPWHIIQNHCTWCFHFSSKCSKIVGGWGSAPDPAGGAHIPLMKSMTLLKIRAPEASISVQNAAKSLAAGARPRPRWGSLHIPLMKSMTHYSESLHQMLPKSLAGGPPWTH